MRKHATVFAAAILSAIEAFAMTERPVRRCDTRRPADGAVAVAAAAKGARAKDAAMQNPYIDLLFVYDKGAKAYAEENSGGISNFTKIAVSRMNDALTNNALDKLFKFRAVGIMTVDDEQTELDSALSSVCNGYGKADSNLWSPVHKMRDECGADIVACLIDTGSDTGLVGLGYSMEEESELDSFGDWGYNVCAIRVIENSLTMLHEIGHNMGAGHSDMLAPEIDPGPQLYDYSSGYEFFDSYGRGWHTIMGYDSLGDGSGDYYDEIPFFSSPDRLFVSDDGLEYPVGNYSHDNETTLRSTYSHVKGWRDTKVEVEDGDDVSTISDVMAVPGAEWTVSADFPWTVYDDSTLRTSVTGRNKTSELAASVEGYIALQFSYRLDDESSELDVYIDGVRVWHKGYDDFDSWWDTALVDIPEGKHEVRILVRSTAAGTKTAWLDNVHVFRTKAPVFSPAPENGKCKFDDSVLVRLVSPAGDPVSYRIDDGDAQECTGPVLVRENCFITAWATNEETGASPEITVEFVPSGNGIVRAGAWTGDAQAAYENAKNDGRLVVTACLNYETCGWSRAFVPVASDPAFLAWAEMNGVYLVNCDPTWMDGYASSSKYFFPLYFKSQMYKDFGGYVYYPTLVAADPSRPDELAGEPFLARAGEQVGGIEYDGTPDSLAECIASYLGAEMPAGISMEASREGGEWKIYLVNDGSAGRIYWTSDGSAPTVENGNLYEGCISIASGYVLLRAAVWTDGGISGIPLSEELSAVDLPPDAPDGLIASQGDYDDGTLVSWNGVGNATGYAVYRFAGEDGEGELIGETDGTFWWDGDVDNGGHHFYRVASVNAAGEGEKSQAALGWAFYNASGGFVFIQDAAEVEEGATVEASIYGGSQSVPCSVKVYAIYQTAAASDLDLAKGAVDGIVPRGGIKFPLSLSWNAGETGKKTVSIPVKADKTIENSEFFTLMLADPSGLGLGDKTEMKVTVEDPLYAELKAKYDSGTASKSETNTWNKLQRNGIYVYAIPSPANAGTVSGSAFCAEGKKVALKATPAKGCAFTGWSIGSGKEGYVATTPSLVIDRTAKPGMNTATSTTLTDVAEDTLFHACFITAPEDVAAVSLDVAGEELSPEVAAAWTNWCGVAVDWPVVQTGLVATTVKASGLPSGLKLVQDKATKAYSVAGVPTAASKIDAKTGLVKPSVVKFTVTTAAKNSVVYTVDMVQVALPAWATGSFDGVAFSSTGSLFSSTGSLPVPEGLINLTVSAAGKISGKLLMDGLTWTLSATSFNGATDLEGLDDLDAQPAFTATLVGKSGKMAFTNDVTVSAGESAQPESESRRLGIAVGLPQPFNLSTLQPFNLEWTAWQNLWKRADTKASMPVFKKSIVKEIVLGEEGDKNNTVKVTFKKDGAVSFSGKIASASVSGSSQLVPDGETWMVVLYAPEKKNFDGWCVTLPVILETDAAGIVTEVVLAP